MTKREAFVTSNGSSRSRGTETKRNSKQIADHINHLSSFRESVEKCIFQLIAGMCVGQLFQSPLIALHSHVTAQETAAATATFGFVRNLATSMSIVIGGVVFQNGMESKATVLYASLGEIAVNFLGNGASANVILIKSLSSDQQAVVKMAYSTSLQHVWILYACVSGAGLVASLVIKTKALSTVYGETKTGLVKRELETK